MVGEALGFLNLELYAGVLGNIAQAIQATQFITNYRKGVDAIQVIMKAQKEKIKEGKREYLNKDHWDLDSVYLNPLKSFLTRFK